MQKSLRCFVLAALTVGLASTAAAGELTVKMSDGRVTVIAQDVPLRQILAEWARVGSTQMVGADKVVGGPISLQLIDVPEKEALDILLRTAAGYMTAPRPSAVPGASLYDRVIILATSRPPAGNPAPQPFNANQNRPAFPPPMPAQPPPDDDDGDPSDQGPNGPNGPPGTQGPPGMHSSQACRSRVRGRTCRRTWRRRTRGRSLRRGLDFSRSRSSRTTPTRRLVRMGGRFPARPGVVVVPWALEALAERTGSSNSHVSAFRTGSPTRVVLPVVFYAPITAQSAALSRTTGARRAAASDRPTRSVGRPMAPRPASRE